MTSLLQRAFAAVRVWLGMNDPEENHLHASHGWLLPDPAVRPRPDQQPASHDDSLGWPKL